LIDPITLGSDAARTMRLEIERAGGREVCFLAGLTEERVVVNPRAVARGNRHAVLAAARDAEVGEVLLHNHPSGVLEPSDADLDLAARVYEEGLGTGIVDNGCTALYMVVEPPAPRVRARLHPEEVDATLGPGGPLSRRHPGFEDRPAQRRMARLVTEGFNEGGVLVVEAGTGTGKSLAYLVPAAMWALRNGERTVVSTNTINLQEQLVGKDLPLVGGMVDGELSWSLVKGRGNYVSIRRLLLAAEGAPALFEDDRSGELGDLVEWSRHTSDGSLSDLATAPSPEVWEEIHSDGDICLRARCPHFQDCFYQRARRKANAADVLVVNHALLFADIALREATENWAQSAVLPPYRHVILDEGHNVEDAATSHLGSEVTRTGVFRTLARLERNGKGVLASVEGRIASLGEGGESPNLLRRIRERLRPAVQDARKAITSFFDHLEPLVPAGGDGPVRLGRGDPGDPGEDLQLLAHLERVSASFGRVGRELEELRLRIEDDERLREVLEERLLDLASLQRRLEAARHGLSLVLAPEGKEDAFVRWIEGEGREGAGWRNIRLAAAPVEPGSQLRKGLFEQVETAVVTSATLTVGSDGFRFLRNRLGLDSGEEARSGKGRWGSTGGEELLPELAFSDVLPVVQLDGTEDAEPLRTVEATLPSPFDYPSQSLFAVPTDLPSSSDDRPFQAATARVLLEFAEMTGGGIFGLFTSHRALRTVAQLLRDAGAEARWPLFVHGEAPRHLLLSRFVRSRNGILLGTSSFWEGVDVPGDPLRGLVLQKLPFRVPTEPITQARMEALEARGTNPFRSYLLPLAALRLKQGFGRLIRSRADRGAILLLDDRILTKGYGRLLRSSLPPAPLLRGPWAEVSVQLREFYEGSAGSGGCSGEGES
jgi:ATP-dependent DNA helicase DinG